MEFAELNQKGIEEALESYKQGALSNGDFVEPRRTRHKSQLNG